MKVAIIGAGYVGLTTSATLAILGHQVVCVDNDIRKILALKGGQAPFYEPGMDELLVMAEEQLTYTTDHIEALQDAQVVFLAVGTPQNSDGSPDLSQFWQAVESVLNVVAGHNEPVLLVNKSTVPVGTGEKVQKRLLFRGLAHRVNIAANPEFLRQGSALTDNFFPYRLVLGGNTRAHEILEEVYAPLIHQTVNVPEFIEAPPDAGPPAVFRVDLQTAELSKYAANAFLAMKISFINEMANVSELVGADVKKIADIIGADRRIGRMFLNAGIGYGGSCFPKDTRALRFIAGTRGYDFQLLSAVIEVNNRQCYRLIHKLRQAMGSLEEKTVCILGLTFKPGTDDLREAPSIPIIHALMDAGARVQVHDPVALDKAQSMLPAGVRLCPTVEAALFNADAVALLTEWPLYRQMSPRWIRTFMRGDILVDGRNCWPSERFAPYFTYIGMGCGSSMLPLREPVESYPEHDQFAPLSKDN